VRHDRGEVAGSHACRKQALVGVPERRVGHKEWLVRPDFRRETCGPDLEKPVPRSGGCHRREVDGRKLRRRFNDSVPRPVRAVDRCLRKVHENLCSTVTTRSRLEKLGTLVNERRRNVARDEVGVVEQGLKECDVRRHSPDAELGESPSSPRDGGREVTPAGRHLREHRIEVRRHSRSLSDASTVESNSRSTRGTVGRNPARVGSEARVGVLGRDSALKCGTAHRERLLR